MNLTFLGASEVVTGSKALLDIGNKRILIDCGLYQGSNSLEKGNTYQLPIPSHSIDIIFLTHAHLDHCGLLPKLIHDGFTGDIYCTEATKKLVRIILEDSARIQAAEIRNQTRRDALYDQVDVEQTMSLIRVIDFNEEKDFGSFKVEFYNAGHILGAASVVIENIDGERIGFTGDIGRADDLLHKAPDIPDQLDYLVIESTYGNRLHRRSNPYRELIQAVESIKSKGGVLLIPAFAVARTQLIVQMLADIFEISPRLKIPVYVDSPMGVRATKVYEDYSHLLKIDRKKFDSALNMAMFIEYGKDLKRLSRQRPPFILISSSGMISGGKILKYFDMYAHHERNTILLTGHQGEGTLGRAISEGFKEVEMFGHILKVTAQVKELSCLSAHGDRDDLYHYIQKANVKRKIFLNHGEAVSIADFAHFLKKRVRKVAVITAKLNLKYEL